jgi:hypothetical protein
MMTPPSPADLRLAWSVLSGEQPLRDRPLERQRVARALAVAAERHRCGLEPAPLERVQAGFRALWERVRRRREEPAVTQWPLLAAACARTAELLSLQLEEAGKLDIGRGTRVHALVGGAAPVRVFRAALLPDEPVPRVEGEYTRCHQLVSELFGERPACVWALEREVEGSSKMAGLVLREMLARWPQVFEGIECIGLTGELDEKGRVLEVGDIGLKVQRFFDAYPSAVCFVPASQWAEARKALIGHNTPERWNERRLYPFRSITDLLVRFGVVTPQVPATRFFQQVREAARTAVDWKRHAHVVARMVDLRVRPESDEREHRYDSRWRADKVLTELCWVQPAERWASGAVVGGAGSGKSIWLRRFHWELLEGSERLRGPSVRIDARRYTRGASVASLLSSGPGVAWTGEEIASFLESPELAGSIWLLVDGIDELPELERAVLMEWVRQWPGPFLLTSRPLRSPLQGALRFGLQPLDASQAGELLELEGRPDLAKSLDPYGPGYAGARTPLQSLLLDICRTPLGASLVATLLKPGFEAYSRQTLLAEGMKELVYRAAREGRLKNEDDARFFELKGERIMGEVAWGMLREGRSEMRSEDFDALSEEVALRLLAAVEQSGIAPRVGPGQWAFSHKSFAEHCAARHLLRLGPEAALRELDAHLGLAGVDEVLLHVSAALPRQVLGTLLEALSRNRRLPFSAYALATRVLLEVDPSLVEPEFAVAVLDQRLRWLTWFPSQELPGLEKEEEPVWSALERLVKARVLGPPEAEVLVGACHPRVRSWLGREGEAEVSELTYEGRQRAERLGRLLPLKIPVGALLRFDDGARLLVERRGRGDWALVELKPYLDHPEPSIARAAREAWSGCAPLDALVSHLEFVSEWEPKLVSRLLDVLREHGSERQKKEALLRAVVGRTSFNITDWEGDRIGSVCLAGRLRDISSDEWLAFWDRAWRIGALGEEGWQNDEALEHLYAHYLHDDCGPARWRALVAIRHLGSAATFKTGAAKPVIPPEVKTLLLHEPLREVRIEALALLREAGESVSIRLLLPSLITLDDVERWVAWRLLLAGGWRPSTEQLVEILIPRTVKRRVPGASPVEADAPRWRAASRRHGEEARYALVDHIRRSGLSRTDVESLFELGRQGMARETIGDILSSEVNLPVADRLHLLMNGPPDVRGWAAQRLQYGSDEAASQYLAGLIDDPVPEVAEVAREVRERLERKRAREREPKRPNLVPVRRIDGKVIRGFDLSWREGDHGGATELAEAFDPKRLPELTTFEALWRALERHPLEFKGARDMVAHFDDDALDWLGELAGEAQLENLRLIRPVLASLERLCQSEHIPSVVAALDHPQLGYLAAMLLRHCPPGRMLLPAFHRGETAAVRAAHVASGTPLASVATDEFIQALVSGRWTWAKAKDSHLAGYSDWVSALHGLGGFEGLLELLVAHPPTDVRREVLAYIDREGGALLSRVSEATRQRIATWARAEASNGSDVTSRAVALHLLGRLGTPEDVRVWEDRLLREADLPAPVVAAALVLMSWLGSAQQLPLIEKMLKHPEPEVVLAAMEACGEHAPPELLLRLLGTPSEELRLRSIRFQPRRRTYDRWYSWSTCLARGVVMRGSREQARELARLLRDDRDAWQLVGTEGRLPEHVLLLRGLLVNDPGESVMPASVTGGGDEVMESGVPEKATRIILELARKLGKEAVGHVLVEALLEEEADWVRISFESDLEELGGPWPSDIPVLLEHLRQHPGSGMGLTLLARTGAGEPELVALWEELGVPWWRS